MTEPTELEVNVSFNIESVEIKEDEEDDEYPKRVVFGYSPGDEVEIGGETHEVSYVNFTKGYENYQGDFTIRTECGLSMSGPIDKVIPILNDST